MLMTRGGKTFSEIAEQPDKWLESIKVYNKHRETLVWIKKMKFEQVVFIGGGASYAVATFADHIFRTIAKMPAIHISPSELLENDVLPFDLRRRTLIFAISGTGENDDIIWAMDKIRKIKSDYPIIAVTTGEKSRLASKASRTVLINGAKDELPVPIKSFSTSTFVLSLIAGALGGNAEFLGELSKIPKVVDVKNYHAEINKMRNLQSIKSMTICGTGYNLAMAQYMALIVQEMSITPSHAIHSLEYRHGNYMGTNNTSMCVHLLSNNLKLQEIESMHDAARMKSQIFLIAEDIDERVEAGVEYSLKFKSGASEFAQVFHLIPVIQLISFQHSLSKGMNPDKQKSLAEEVKYKHQPEI